MYIEGIACWLNHMVVALEKYNTRVLENTKMSPFEMLNKQKLRPNLIFRNNNKMSEFQVGELVRVPDKRNFYSKGCTTNWNREVFKIYSINKTSPVTYGLEDENKEIIQGRYYDQELLRSVFNFESNTKTLESMNIFHKLE